MPSGRISVSVACTDVSVVPGRNHRSTWPEPISVTAAGSGAVSYAAVASSANRVQSMGTVGRMKSFWGNFGMLIRAYTYIRANGAEGLKGNSEYAVLNANYLRAGLEDVYHLPYGRTCKHEFVVEGVWHDAPGVHALDISKRLVDYGFHAPTNYFPLIVHEALMIEPTETESRETLDAFIAALRQIAEVKDALGALADISTL